MPTKINVPADSLVDEAQPPADEFPEGTPLDERTLGVTETDDDTPGQEVPPGPTTSPPLADAMELEAERDARGMSANMYDMDYLLQVKPNYPVGVGEHPITEPRKGDFFKTMKGKLPSTTVPKKQTQEVKKHLAALTEDEEMGTMVTVTEKTPPHNPDRVLPLSHEDFRLMCDYDQALSDQAFDYLALRECVSPTRPGIEWSTMGVLPAFFGTLLCNLRSEEDNVRGFDYTAVKDFWKDCYPEQTMFHFDHIVIPMNPQENHWYLVVIFMKERVIEILDSDIAEDELEYNIVLKAVLAWLVRVYIDEAAMSTAFKSQQSWKLCPPRSDILPQQAEGSVECGMYAGLFIRLLRNKIPFSRVSRKYFEGYRRRVLADLVEEYRVSKDGNIKNAEEEEKAIKKFFEESPMRFPPEKDGKPTDGYRPSTSVLTFDADHKYPRVPDEVLIDFEKEYEGCPPHKCLGRREFHDITLAEYRGSTETEHSPWSVEMLEYILAELQATYGGTVNSSNIVLHGADVSERIVEAPSALEYARSQSEEDIRDMFEVDMALYLVHDDPNSQAHLAIVSPVDKYVHIMSPSKRQFPKLPCLLLNHYRLSWNILNEEDRFGFENWRFFFNGVGVPTPNNPWDTNLYLALYVESILMGAPLAWIPNKCSDARRFWKAKIHDTFLSQSKITSSP